MADLLPPATAEQLGWLSVAPPSDEHGRPIVWTLSDCSVEEARWATPIVHEQLTLERVQITAVQWQGPVFRNCVLREVAFVRSTFARARFENVTFEKCSFERSTFENCGFDHCRFVDCAMTHQIAIRTALRFCEFDTLALMVLDMREGDLSGCTFEESSLQGPRISQSRAETLTIVGGELRGADWTVCELPELSLDGVTVEGLRILDSELGRVKLAGGRVEGLAISGSKIAGIALAGCFELPGARMIDCRVDALMIDACPSVASLLLADCTVGRFAVQGSVLYDASFERLEVEGARFEGGSLTGVLFQEGAWQTLELVDVALADYVAVRSTRFDQLRLDRVKVDPNIDLRLDGDQYGDGSMTWGGVRGP